ncbi:7716_t:CDS:2, partial [Cetraspora pellucida]
MLEKVDECQQLTNHQKLISISDLISSASFQNLKSLGYTKLSIQYGKSCEAYNETMKIQIVGYDYKSSLNQRYLESDLIISHA